MTPAKEPVAFLGIGTMGHAMATNALKAGIPTFVWNREPGATQGLADLGAKVAESPADAARNAGIVVTMVTDADSVLSIAKDQGMLAALTSGAVWVQMSTIGVAGIERVTALVDAERPDIILIDAPVSGSKEPAEKGQLTIFASGSEAVRSRLEPLFGALGQRTIWVGPVGTGSRLKLVANAWLALEAEAVNTSVALARHLGLETETVVNALDGSPLVSPWQAAKLERVTRDDFSVQFALSLALKDVHLALEAAADDRFRALASVAGEWQAAVDRGLGDLDLTVVVSTLEDQRSDS
ncbi:MAG TPA: NAD(P)-dependent oxidoreductase [Acidimicrobiales bacterium]|nr:NAD(P)-dependent oxidoreductase [Acidimicrobiales bacterium]